MNKKNKVKKTTTLPDSTKSENSFLKFILQKEQLLDFSIIFISCLLAYLVIHFLYPYPFTFSDSGGYVEAAAKNIFYVYRPFGYSFFLQILHKITPNIHLIFITQTFLLFLATSFLAFTVKYFYTPNKKWLWYISLLFLIFAPTSFIMANWILSDLLFSVQIYLIVTLFIFIIKRNSWISALLYLLLLFTTLHVRYSATIFPFVLIPFFLMKKGKVRWFVTIASILVFSFFYLQTKKSMKNRVHIEQFSTGFDGWHYLNDALYALPYIDINSSDFNSAKLRNLHSFIMDDIDIITEIVENKQVVTSIFTWDNKLPLKQYMNKTMREQNTQYLPTFVKVGSGIYKDYAFHIMTHYPFSFLRYYYVPNFKQTFYPNPGCIQGGFDRAKVIYEYYNIDDEEKMKAKYKPLSNPLYHSVIKILHLIMWGIIVGIGIVAFLKRKKIPFSKADSIVFWGLFCFAGIYYATSIFAAPMEIRYCISMHSIQFVYCYVLLNKLLDMNKKCSEENNLTSEKKLFLRLNKKIVIYSILIFFVVFSFIVLFIIKNSKTPKKLPSIEKIKWEEMNDSKMKEYIEACRFFENFPDTVKVITRKPEIFYEFSGNKKAESFPWDANADAILEYLKTVNATHLIIDDRFRHAYLTLYPALQKYPEKFKMLKKVGEIDTVKNLSPTFVFEFNDVWGYYGERTDGKKTGEGYELFQDGRKYVGHFENNNFNGEGTLFDANGKMIFKGFWQDGVIIKGEGELNYSDGKKYVGEFNNNRPEGYGTLYDAAGKILNRGNWKNGVLN